VNGAIIRAISTFVRSRGRQLCGISALAACLAVGPAEAFTTVQVRGSSKDVSINAQNSSIKDVLSALGGKFNLQFQSSTNLDKQLTGTYQGSLLRVVSRLLEGYNFIIRSNQDRLEVTVLGIQNGSAVSEPSNIANVSTIACNAKKLAADMKSCLGKPGFSDVILGGCIRNANVLREGFMMCKADAKTRQNYDSCPADQQIATMRTVGNKLNLYRSGYCGFG
jgi:hypothetical protein